HGVLTMGNETDISWADHTASPWLGCQKVSPACDGCYAEALMDKRFGRVSWGPHGERQRAGKGFFANLRAWDRAAAAAGRRATVFPSLCAPFDNHPSVKLEWRAEWFAVMRDTPHLIYLLLTKRPQNIVKMAESAGGLPSNAALGATCEDQTRADINV